MNMTQKQPKAEWGRYAMTPRIVRTHYKDLSHAEKWLYVCLKDLCGDKGVCFRTLRTLAEETDISTGSLSTMIPHLHKSGLIHAEKKRRSNNPTAKEVWHITIVDIWQANVEECSVFEHHEENVQNMNNIEEERSYFEPKRSEIEPKRSEIEQQRSKNEPKRSDFVDRRIHSEEDKLKDNIEGDRSGETTSPHTLAQSVETFFLENVAEPAPLEKLSPLVAPKTRYKPARARTPKEVKPKPDIFADASPEIQAIVTEWRTIFKTPVSVTAKLIEHATTLADFQPEPGEIIACRLWMYQTDTKKWYSTHGMQLGDVAREFEKFRSLASVPEVAAPKGRQISSFDDPNYDMSSEFYPSAIEKASYAHAAR